MQEQISNVFAFMNLSADTNMFKKRKQVIDASDKYRSQNFLETFPELREIYETIRNEDKEIIKEIAALKEEFVERHEKLSSKMAEMQRFIWVYSGALAVIAFLLSYGGPIIRLLSTTAK